MNKIILILFSVLLWINASSQEDITIRNTFKGTRLVNAHSANLAREGKLMLLVQHRFGDMSNGAYEFFGLDQATMRLGFEYGFSDNFNFGIGRSTFLKTYDIFGKLNIFRQSSEMPLSAVLSAEASAPTLKNYFPAGKDAFSDKLSTGIQLHLASRIRGIGLQLSPGYLKTGYLPGINDNISSFTLGVGGSVSFSKKVSLNLEYLNAFHSDLQNNSPFSIGVDIDTGGHLFQLIVSNSQKIYGQALYTQTDGDWGNGNIFFGFNLIREFNLKYKDGWNE